MTTPDQSPDDPHALPTAAGDAPTDEGSLLRVAHLPPSNGVIGPYRLLHVLGEGGFGVVWLAERREPHVQRVAIKVVKPGMDSRAVIARFERERQALAVMDHPNVARVFDAGTTSEHRPYFVMEHVPGEPITTYCDRNRMTLRKRIELFIPVCEAVQHAHMKGVIHRDLKPSNILVATMDGVPVPKVIDFGVAKSVGATPSPATIDTGRGQVLGTPEYMSPEQAESGALDVDTRTDVYSLGVVLYEILAGVLPLESALLRRRGPAEAHRALRDLDPPRPSLRLSGLRRTGGTESAGNDVHHAALLPDPRRIARDRCIDLDDLISALRRELEWIPLKAMRYDRAARYATARELAGDLRHYLDGRPLDAGPESATYRLRKFYRRNRGVVVAASAVAAAILLGFAGTTIGLVAASRRAEGERIATIAADEERQRANQRSVELEQALAASNATRDRLERSSYIANIEMAGAWLALERWRPLRRRLDACPPARRGWEWNWLDATADNAMLVLTAEGAPARSVAFSPTGDALLGAFADGTLRLWQAASGREIATLVGHRGPVGAIAFSPDGRLIATGSDDGTLRTWSAGSGAPLATLGVPASDPEVAQRREWWRSMHDERSVLWTSFDATGRRLVTLTWDGVARLWSLDARELHSELPSGEAPLNLCALDPSGTRVAGADWSGMVFVWDLESGTASHAIEAHDVAVWCLAWSPDGRSLLSVDQEGAAHLWDTDSGNRRISLAGHDAPVRGAAFDPTGRLLATGDDRGVLRRWNAETGELLGAQAVHRASIIEVVRTADGASILTASYDGTMRVVDASDGTIQATLRGHLAAIEAASLDATGDRVASASRDGSVRTWELRPPGATRSTRSIPLYLHDGAFSPDGMMIAVAGTRPGIQVLDSRSLTTLMTIEDTDADCVAFDPSGGRIAAAIGGGRVNIRRIADPTQSIMLRAHSNTVTAIAFDPASNRVLTTSRDGSAAIWNGETGAELARLEGHDDFVEYGTFSPDGTRIATASDDGTVRIWDAANGAEVARLGGDLEMLTTVRYSADGTRLVMASHDGTARVWDAHAFVQIATLDHGGSSVLDAGFSPDGSRIVTATASSRVCVWHAEDHVQLVELPTVDPVVSRVVFSPDGRRLMAVMQGGAIQVWDSAPTDGRGAGAAGAVEPPSR